MTMATGLTTSYTTNTWTNWVTSDSTTAYVWDYWTTATSDTTSTTAYVWYAWTEPVIRQDQIGFKKSNKILAKIVKPPSFAERNQAKIHGVWAAHLQDLAKQEAKVAELKAQDLLLDLIGSEMLQVYKDTKRLIVHGNKFDYLLDGRDRHRPLVKRIEKDKIVDLCIHLKHDHEFPTTDNFIGLMLAMKADEDAFNCKANRIETLSLPPHLPRAANI